MLIRLPLSEIERQASGRSPDYRIVLLAAGIVEGLDLLIADETCARIHAEYSPQVPAAPQLPGFGSMLSHFASSILAWAKAGFPVTTEAQLAERRTICHACPHWNGTALIARCRLCGCGELKPWLATERCPDKPSRWPALHSPSEGGTAIDQTPKTD